MRTKPVDVSMGKQGERWASLKPGARPRKTYLGLRIAPEQLELLQAEADRLKVGVSTLAHAVLVEWLRLRQKAKGGGTR